MKKSLLAALAATALLSACSNASKGKDAEGNCTMETISAFNDIPHKARMYDSTRDSDYLVGIKNKCAELKSLIGNGSCKAVNTTTEETVHVSYADVSKVCDLANSMLEKSSANKNESESEQQDEKE